MRILCGLRRPDTGEIAWYGEPVSTQRERFLAQTAYLGHAPAIKLDLTPLENLRVASALHPVRGDSDPWHALRAVGLGGFEDVPARSLSAGQKRRVALARLLMTGALLWILDEPFTAIDVRGVREIEQLLTTHANQGGIVVLTTHHAADLDECRVQNLHLGA